MINPSDVKTRDKERDAQIINDYLDELLTMEEIGAKNGITRQAVQYILHNNKEIIKLDREFERTQRVTILKRILSKLPETISTKKDITDVIAQLRAEFEGDGNKINIISQFFQIEMPANTKNRLNEIQA